jgi:endonuclease/exonuclease/phosphatase family metal-dependent hydrolase
VRSPLRRLWKGLLAVVVAVISPTLFACSSHLSRSSSSASFSLLQMNLCLSGQAGCYAASAYPAALDEAARVIDDRAPDAVTINEACRRDVAELARRTGYQLSFTGVDYGGEPLPCIDPGGRGLFGIAVLTKDVVRTSHEGTFTVRADPEDRRWLCATTNGAVTVCTAHLSTRISPGDVVDNDAQCRQLREVLARRAHLGATFFGGDLNRQDSCAPATMSVARDTSATRSAGVQHIYANRPLDERSTSIIEAAHTDHDFLFAAAPTDPLD